MNFIKDIKDIWITYWYGPTLVFLAVVSIFFISTIFYKPSEKSSDKIVIQKNEISKKQYKKLLEHSIKYGYYKFLAWEALEDGIITEEEFSNIETIYTRISRMDNVNLLLQEKAYEESPEHSDE